MTPEEALKRVRWHARWLTRDNQLRQALTLVADLAEGRLQGEAQELACRELPHTSHHQEGE